MPIIKVEKPFPFSPDGKSVVDVEAGEQEVSERCATVAVEHLKVATLVKAGAGEPSGDDNKKEPGKAKAGDKAKADEPPKATESPNPTETTKE